MDFTVEIGEPGIESASNTPDSVVNPAADAVRHEYSRALSDPSHPHHEGLKRNSKEANDYFNGLYANAYPATPAPVDRKQEIVILPNEGTDREAAEDAQELQQLRSDWEREGITYEEGFNSAKEMGTIIYNADPKLFRLAAHRLGDALGLRLLRVLHQRLS